MIGLVDWWIGGLARERSMALGWWSDGARERFKPQTPSFRETPSYNLQNIRGGECVLRLGHGGGLEPGVWNFPEAWGLRFEASPGLEIWGLKPFHK
jgi:hypothetical protein